MKKIITTALVGLALCISASAQNASCHFGVLGGVSVNTFKGVTNIKDLAKGVAGWQAGATLLVKLPAYFSIQPTVQFDRVIMRIPDALTIKQNVLDVPVPIQWGPDLGIIRPFIQAVPFVDFNLGGRAENNSGEARDIKEAFKTAQFGVGVGGGFELWKLQLSFRYNWSLGQWADLGNIPLDGTFKDYMDARRSGFVFSLAFFFN